MPRGCESRRSNWTVHDRKLRQGRSREAEPESTTQTELSGRNDSEPHLMSLETANREPSRYLNGEGCHAEQPNSQLGPLTLGGVSEGDRTARADRVSRENSSGASATQPAVQGGNPTEPVKAAGVVGVLRSSVDPSDSKTDGERRRGTWVHVKGSGNGTGDGQGDLDINSDNVSGAVRFTVTADARPTVETPSESRMRENRTSGLMRGRCDESDDDNYGLQSTLPHLPTLLSVCIHSSVPIRLSFSASSVVSCFLWGSGLPNRRSALRPSVALFVLMGVHSWLRVSAFSFSPSRVCFWCCCCPITRSDGINGRFSSQSSTAASPSLGDASPIRGARSPNSGARQLLWGEPQGTWGAGRNHSPGVVSGSGAGAGLCGRWCISSGERPQMGWHL